MSLLTESLSDPIDGSFIMPSGRPFYKAGPIRNIIQLIDSFFVFKWASWLRPMLVGKIKYHNYECEIPFLKFVDKRFGASIKYECRTSAPRTPA